MYFKYSTFDKINGLTSHSPTFPTKHIHIKILYLRNLQIIEITKQKYLYILLVKSICSIQELEP